MCHHTLRMIAASSLSLLQTLNPMHLLMYFEQPRWNMLPEQGRDIFKSLMAENLL